MKNLIIASAALMALVACNKEEPDTTAPTIAVTHPMAEAEYHLGDTIDHIHVDFADDVALGSFQMEIHHGEDHDHRSEEFEWDTTATMSGTTHTFHFTDGIVIPADAEVGEYHFVVNATDSVGNAATETTIEFHIDSTSH